MKAKIYIGAKKYALYISRKIVQKTLEFLTLPARFVSKKVQELKNLTLYGQSKQGLLPDGYTQLEYIESTGTQCIDTGVKFNITHSYYLKFNTLSQSSANIFGARSRVDSGATNNDNISIFVNVSGANTMFIDYNTRYTKDVNVNTDVEITIKPTELILNGVSTPIVTKKNVNGTYNICLFGINSGGTITIGKARFYSFEIRDEQNKAIQNLIPARRNSDNVLGMYDTVTDTFLTNAGTGDFIAGNVAPTPTTPIEIESVGDKSIIYDNSVIDSYKQGTPSVTDDGLYTLNNATSYLRTPNVLSFATANQWSFKWSFTYKSNTVDQGIMSGNGDTNVQAIINSSGQPRMSFGTSSGWFSNGIWNVSTGAGVTVKDFKYVNGKFYDNEIRFTGTRYEYLVDGELIGYCESTSKASNTYFALGVERQRTSTQYSRCTWNLTKTSLIIDGVEYLTWNKTKYKVPVTVGGKNLFDVSTSTYHMFYNSNGQYTTASSVSVSDWIKVKPNTRYTLSGVTTDELVTTVKRVNFFDDNKEWLSQPVAINNYPITFTTDSSTSYVRFSFGQITIDTVETNIQVEQGNTATPYQPYVAPTTTNVYLSEPLRKIGGYADTLSVDGTDVTVVRNIGSLLLNTVSFNYSNALKTFYSANVVVNKVANLPNVYCEVFRWSDMLSATWTASDKSIGINVTSAGTTRTGNFALKTLAIKDTDFTTQAELKNAIGDAKVYYALATPTTETYTIENPIQLTEGTLTIDTDTKIKPSKINITGDIDNE